MLTIYKASAGSGKTYNLALYYIKILLGIKDKEKEDGEKAWTLNYDPASKRLKYNNQHRGILAITFTRKATEEMKQRIVAELSALAKLPAPDEEDANYAETLTKEFGCSREHLREAAQLSLQQLLFNYQDFNVSTIDSFFQRVLHTFAREIDIQADYQVELNDKQAMQTAVGQMLDDFNTSADGDKSKKAQLGRWLYEHMRSLMYDGRKADFLNRDSKAHSSLVDLVAQISKESFKPFKDGMMEYLQGDDIETFGNAVEEYKKEIVRVIKLDAQASLAGIDLSKVGTSRTTKPGQIIKDFLMAGRPVRDIDEWQSTAMKNLADPESEVTFAPKGGVVLEGETEDHARAVKEFMERAYAKYIVYYVLQSISESLTQLGLLRYAWDYLQRLVEENNLVLISDTNELLAKVIGDTDTPFVYERMGLQLVHHLIDEFQDTSKMQWDVLRPLVKIGVSDREDSLIIGDEKQSIYRFRNSDSSILHHGLDEDFAAYPIEPKGRDPKENTNYRSSPDVVRFNNTLFTHLAQMLGVPGFENVVQGIKKKHPGHVKFIADKSKTVLDDMTQEISRLVDQGGYFWKDIAVLVDTNKQCATVVDHLIKAGIPVLSDEALFLYKSWAVQLVINTLRIIDREQSGETKPFVNEAGKEIRKYATNAQVHNVMSQFEIFLKDDNDKDYSRALDRAMLSLDGDTPDPEVYDSVRRIMDRHPASLAALIETVIEEQFPDEPGRAPHSAYLAALQDAALSFSANKRSHGASSLHAFLDWWDANPRLAIGGASEADAVKVMTIHKSKGLEFHCVLIPFCSWYAAWDGIRTPSIWTDSLTVHKAKLDQAIANAGLPPFDLSSAPGALYVKLNKQTRLDDSPFKDDYDRERLMAITDTLNKTYVAFTRAKSELIVWVELPSKPNADIRDNKIGVAITQAFEKYRPDNVPDELCLDFAAIKPQRPEKPKKGKKSSDSECADNPEDDKLLIEIGAPTVRVADDKEEKEQAERAKRDEEALRVGYDVDIRQDMLKVTSLQDKPEIKDKQPQSDIQDEGTMLHDVMAMVAHPADLPRALEMAAERHSLPAAKVAEYERMLAGMMADSRARQWFEGYARVYIEQPIYQPGAIDSVARPDRVVVLPDGTVDVIDYKFGYSEAQHAEHVRQVANYVSLMRQMGHKTVRGYVVYPRDMEIKQI